MTPYELIEQQLTGMIAAIENNGEPLFRHVAPLAVTQSRTVFAAAYRAAKPAAFITLHGRDNKHPPFTLSDTHVSIHLAAEHRQATDLARAQAYQLAQQATAALDNTTINGIYRLNLATEQLATGDGRCVIIRQDWLVQHPPAIALPTYDGQQITGTDSVVDVRIGRLVNQLFATSGLLSFERLENTSDRTIAWSGHLRAADHAQLNNIESTIENLVGNTSPKIVADGYGRSYSNCLVTSFLRPGFRHIHPATATVSQEFELNFIQLAEEARSQGVATADITQVAAAGRSAERITLSCTPQDDQPNIGGALRPTE